jgi:hypothetical protein
VPEIFSVTIQQINQIGFCIQFTKYGLFELYTFDDGKINAIPTAFIYKNCMKPLIMEYSPFESLFDQPIRQYNSIDKYYSGAHPLKVGI